MPLKNSVKTALEFAICREVDSYHFYIALAERANNAEMKDVLREFAQQELGHKSKLELELIKMGQTVPIENNPPMPSSPPIPPDISPLLDINFGELLLMAMQKEEASFRTYVDLAPKMLDEESRDVLLAIAEEEVKHKLQFGMEYDMLLKQL